MVKFVPHEHGWTAVPIQNLVRLKSAEDLEQFVLGSDLDIGGKSTVRLELDEEGFGAFITLYVI